RSTDRLDRVPRQSACTDALCGRPRGAALTGSERRAHLLLVQRELDQPLRIHVAVGDLHAPVQVGTGDAPGASDLADELTTLHAVALGDVEGAQVEVEREDAATVVDDHRVAAEEGIA